MIASTEARVMLMIWARMPNESTSIGKNVK